MGFILHAFPVAHSAFSFVNQGITIRPFFPGSVTIEIHVLIRLNLYVGTY